MHVGVGGVQELAIVGNRDDGNRVGLAGRAEVGALQRIDGDVHSRGVVVGVLPAAADALPNEQHRGFVTLAFADDHRSLDLDRVEGAAHRIDGSLVGALAISPSHHAGRGQRGGLCDPDHLQREVAIHVAWFSLVSERKR